MGESRQGGGGYSLPPNVRMMSSFCARGVHKGTALFRSHGLLPVRTGRDQRRWRERRE